jgi:hypothetical protein
MVAALKSMVVALRSMVRAAQVPKEGVVLRRSKAAALKFGGGRERTTARSGGGVLRTREEHKS